MDNWFLDSEYPNTPFKDAKFHIYPFGYEKSVSYGKGTSLGPAAIISASNQLEKLTTDFKEPGLKKMHTAKPIEFSYSEEDQLIFSKGGEAIKKSWENNSFPLVLGGEHSITNSAIEAIVDYYGANEVGILQFDAHMDLRESYLGSKYSHASVMHRAVEKGIKLFQVGVRSYSYEELDVRAKYNVEFIDAHQIYNGKLENFVLPSSFPKKIFISFDVDAFDGSVMAATGTPEPGGLSWWDAITLLEVLTKDREVVGADIVEFAPIKDFHFYDYTVAKLAYHIMSLL